MDYLGLLKALSINALVWVALSAIALPLIDSGDATYLSLFALLVALNLAIVLILKNVAPGFFAQSPYASFAQTTMRQGIGGSHGGNIGFRLYPLSYPRVHDEELRSFAPEFIHIDILSGSSIIFAGNMARDVLKQFREAVSRVLEIKEVPDAASQISKQVM